MGTLHYSCCPEPAFVFDHVTSSVYVWYHDITLINSYSGGMQEFGFFSLQNEQDFVFYFLTKKIWMTHVQTALKPLENVQTIHNKLSQTEDWQKKQMKHCTLSCETIAWSQTVWDLFSISLCWHFRGDLAHLMVTGVLNNCVIFYYIYDSKTPIIN